MLSPNACVENRTIMVIFQLKMKKNPVISDQQHAQETEIYFAANADNENIAKYSFT